MQIKFNEVKFEEEQVKKWIPATVKKRMVLLNEIVAELNKRNFKHLDADKTEDLQKVVSIISEMHPESNYYKIREYAKVSISLWNKQRKEVNQ